MCNIRFRKEKIHNFSHCANIFLRFVFGMFYLSMFGQYAIFPIFALFLVQLNCIATAQYACVSGRCFFVAFYYDQNVTLWHIKWKIIILWPSISETNSFPRTLKISYFSLFNKDPTLYSHTIPCLCSTENIAQKGITRN